MPQRVLLLAPQPFLAYRGTPLSVLNLAEALSRLGHAVDVLTFPGGERVASSFRHIRSAWLPVGRVAPGPSIGKLLLDVPFLVEAAVRLLSGRYDVVHAVEEAAHLIAPVSWLANVPLVADVDSWIPEQLAERGLAPWRWLRTLLEALNRAALRTARVIVTPCRSLTERVAREVRSRPVVQIDDVPLQERWEVTPEAIRFRDGLGLSGAPIVFYAGSLDRAQGAELLVSAASGVAEATFVIAGGEGADVRRLAARARAEGVLDRCRFLGRRPPGHVLAVLDAAHVVVAPRLAGNHTGFKIATCLATGKPLVATRIPAHTQVLDDSLALLVEPSEQGLAEGIRTALAAGPAVQARAERAREHVRGRLSREHFLARVGAAYELLGAAPVQIENGFWASKDVSREPSRK